MSVVNVFVSSQRVAVLTDAAVYTADAIPVSFERKTFPIESWNGAITGRGDIWGTSTALLMAEAYGSFDEFIERSAPEIERVHRDAIATASGSGQTIIEIHAIGWSERQDQPQAFYLQSPHPGMGDSAEAYVWRDHRREDGCFLTELDAREYWRLHRQGAQPHVDFTAESFDPLRHGLPLMEAHRRGVAEAEFGEAAAGRHVVGGEVWLTIVDREGTRQDVIHEWPDAIGEPIQPAPFDEMSLPKIPPAGLPQEWTFERFTRALEGGAIDPKTHKLDVPRLVAIEADMPSAGMSRQQRRAAKAQARKGRAHAA